VSDDGDYRVHLDEPRLDAIRQPPSHDGGYTSEAQRERVNWVIRKSEGSILDIGCAEGYVLGKLAGERVGVDIDRERLKAAQLRYPDCRYYCMDVTFGLPFHDQEFDTVLIAEMLEHIPLEDSRRLIFEALRVAKKKLVITMPFAKENYDPAMVDNPSHEWHVTEETVKRLFDGVPNAFEVNKVKYTQGQDFILISVVRS